MDHALKRALDLGGSCPRSKRQIVSPAQVASVSTAPPRSILGSDLRAVLGGPGWSVWRPNDPPWPAPRGQALKCMNGSLHFKLPRRINQPLCLAPNDHLSRHLRRRGQWRDCERLKVLWMQVEASAPRGAVSLFMEVGTNIGACTLELLLATSARIVAFEPNPVNLWYATRSLNMAARTHPTLANRVVLFPVALGDESAFAPIYAQRRNLGNSVIGASVTEHDKSRDSAEFTVPKQSVPVIPLDTIFPHGLKGVGLLKVDTQGFECNVLRGAQRALRSGHVDIIEAEVSPRLLDAQCCSEQDMAELLLCSGFNLSHAFEGTRAEHTFVARRMRASLAPEYRATGNPSSPCCKDLEPEKGHAGRCTGYASRGRFKRRKDTYCPVACGTCQVCADHPLHAAYLDLVQKARSRDTWREHPYSLRDPPRMPCARRIDTRGV